VKIQDCIGCHCLVKIGKDWKCAGKGEPEWIHLVKDCDRGKQADEKKS
jgi:hypothetical protein